MDTRAQTQPHGAIQRFKKKPLLCLRCGRPAVKWPSLVTDEFYDAHRCPAGESHVYGDASVAECLRGAGML